MLTGRRPFQGEYEKAIIYDILYTSHSQINTLRAEIPEKVGPLIALLLEKQPELRCASLTAVKETLMNASNGAQVLDSGSHPIRTKQTIFGIGIGILAILILTAIILIPQFVLFQSNLNPNQIMVVDFENRTGNSSLDPVGTMAAGWIRQGLIETGFLEVLDDRTSQAVTQYLMTQSVNSKMILSRTLSRETGAGLVVTGAYFLQGETVQLQVQINNTISRTL
jgi:hypothetical protein